MIVLAVKLAIFSDICRVVLRIERLEGASCNCSQTTAMINSTRQTSENLKYT